MFKSEPSARRYNPSACRGSADAGCRRLRRGTPWFATARSEFARFRRPPPLECLSLSRRFVDKAEIKSLIGGDIFSAVAQALLGEVDGAFHPGLICAAIGWEPAQVQFKKRFRQRVVFDVEII